MISFDVPSSGDYAHSLHVANVAINVDPNNVVPSDCNVFGIYDCNAKAKEMVLDAIGTIGSSLGDTLNGVLVQSSLQPAFESALSGVTNGFMQNGGGKWAMLHNTAVLSGGAIKYQIQRFGPALPISKCSVRTNRCALGDSAQLTSCALKWPSGLTSNVTSWQYTADDQLFAEVYNVGTQTWSDPLLLGGKGVPYNVQTRAGAVVPGTPCPISYTVSPNPLTCGVDTTQ